MVFDALNICVWIHISDSTCLTRMHSPNFEKGPCNGLKTSVQPCRAIILIDGNGDVDAQGETIANKYNLPMEDMQSLELRCDATPSNAVRRARVIVW